MNRLYKSILGCLISAVLVIFLSFSTLAQNVGGNDFWFTFPMNYAYGQASPGVYQLVIVSGCPTTGRIEYPALGQAPTTFTVTPGQSTLVTISIPSNTINEQISNAGIHITSDNLIAVYAIDYLAYSVDGESVLRTSQLGKDYIINGHSSNGMYTPSQATIVATENGTVVNITPSVPTTSNSSVTTSHAAGSTWSVTLNAGQTYMFSAYASGSITSLSKTKISANKPIVAISHSACTDYICASCDMIMAQHIPTNLWGTKYITAQAQARLGSADVLEITTGASAASISMNNGSGNSTLSIPANSNRIITPPGGECNTVLTSSAPIQVTQYSQGASCDGSSNTDPEHIVIYPENMWISDYTFACSNTLTSSGQGLCIVTDAAVTGINSFELDGTPVPSTGWTAIGTSTYKYRRMAVATGNHKLTNVNGNAFGFYQYALGSAESYIVQGGVTYNNCLIVLPKELISFTAKPVDDVITLNWIMASENNSAGYIIERSTDGELFKSISTLINSKGNGSAIHSYSFTDNNPQQGYNYYRIKQLNQNGAYSYTKTISTSLSKINRLEIKAISPIPAKDFLKLELNLVTGQEVEISIFNTLGQLLKSTTLPASIEGQGSYEIPIQELNNGVYILNIKQGNTIQRTRFTKE